MLALLRSATRAQHARLERATGLLPHLSLDRYRWFLAKLYGFLGPLEAGWASRSDLGLDLEQRRRAPLLARDLRILGDDPEQLPRCHALPEIDSTAKALGVVYVMEGSTLGGQFLAGRVEQTLQLGPGEGAAFLVGHGPRTQALWNEVIERLQAFADEQPQQIGSVIESAGLCFDRLRAWFEENE